MGVDESLDVWACHGVGGTWGVIAVGLFATVAVNPSGTNGLFYGNVASLGKQIIGVLVIAVFSFVMTWVLGTAIKTIVGFRVSEIEERVGLDISQHGENMYGPIP